MEYHCSKAEDIIGHLTRPLQRNTDVVAIVDPPRGGLRKLTLLNIKYLWHLLLFYFFWGGGMFCVLSDYRQLTWNMGLRMFLKKATKLAANIW